MSSENEAVSTTPTNNTTKRTRPPSPEDRAPHKKPCSAKTSAQKKLSFRNYRGIYNMEHGHFLVVPLKADEKPPLFNPELAEPTTISQTLFPSISITQSYRTDLIANLHWLRRCHCKNLGHIWIENIHVEERVRRRGIGTSMVREFLDFMVPFSYEDVKYVCFAPAHSAVPFWKKQGMIRVTPELVKQEPHLRDHDWCIPIVQAKTTEVGAWGD